MNIKKKKPLFENVGINTGSRPMPNRPTMNNSNLSNNLNLKDTSILDTFVDSIDDKPSNWKSINKTLAALGIYAASTFLKKKLDKHLSLDASNSSPSMYVRYWKIAVSEMLDMLSEGQKLLLIKRFGIDIIKAINENNQQINNDEKILSDEQIDDIESFIFDKGGKFKFDCDVEMEALNAPNTDLSNFQQSLKFHDKETNNFQSFLESVTKFIEFTDNSLSEFDVKKLEQHYIKYHGRY